MARQRISSESLHRLPPFSFVLAALESGLTITSVFFGPHSSALPVRTLDFVADPVCLHVHASLVYPEGDRMDKTQLNDPKTGQDLRTSSIWAATAAETSTRVLT